MTGYVHTPESAAQLRRDFPAKFSAPIIDALEAELQRRLLHNATVLDPTVGTGVIYDLADRLPLRMAGIDIEPELAALDPRSVCGDSRYATRYLDQLRAIAHMDRTELFSVAAFSPAYGNRFADQYLGSDTEKCRPCNGRGWVVHKSLADLLLGPDGKLVDNATAEATTPAGDRLVCKKCEGRCTSKSARAGYAIALGRKLTVGSGAAAGWGQRYKTLHLPILAAVDQCLEPGGWWMVNVSSSIRQEAYADVMEWWVERLAERARVVALRAIETPRNGYGQNGDDRVPVEHLIVAQKAG